MISTRSLWVTAGLLVVGIVHVALTLGVDRSWGTVVGWPLLVGAAFVAGFVSPRHWGWWGPVTLVPLAVTTLLGDQILDVGDRGTGSVTTFVVIIQALVATGAALMGSQLAELGATGGVRPGRGRGVTVTLALLVFGTLAAVALVVTTDGPENDTVESGLFWWLWVLFPVAAAVAGVAFPRLSAWWGFVVVAPVMVVVVIAGTVFWDDDLGTSPWVIGEVVLLVLAGWSTVFALMGAALARRSRSGAALEVSHG